MFIFIHITKLVEEQRATTRESTATQANKYTHTHTETHRHKINNKRRVTLQDFAKVRPPQHPPLLQAASVGRTHGEGRSARASPGVFDFHMGVGPSGQEGMDGVGPSDQEKIF